MIFHVSDILPAIAEKWGGGGVSLCNTDGVTKALAAYNRINEILMTRQDWPGTEDHIAIPVHCGTFTLPPRFESIKAVKVDGHSLPIVPMGFQYLSSTPSGLVACNHENLQHLGSNFPTFRDLPKPLPIFAVSDQTEALTVTIHGTDAAGRNIVAKIPATTAYPDRSPEHSAELFATITSVSKPRTKGHIELVAWDNVLGESLWLSTLAPDETSPGLTRYALPNVATSQPCHIQARVSATYREIWNVDEVALIQAREPYRLMMQALNHFDRSELAPGAEFQNRAVKLLKERAGKLAIGQEVIIPKRQGYRLPNRHGYSIRNYQA